MADDRKLPFYKRAFQNYKEEMEDISTVLQNVHDKYLWEIEDYREPLAVTERKEVTIELSTGGPSDGYKIYFDQENTAVEGFYYFADWFEYEELTLTPEELNRVLAIYF